MVMAPVELRGHRQHDGQVRGALMGLRRPFALRFRTDGMLLLIPSCGGATRRQAHGQQTIRGNKATATNRPCLGFALKSPIPKERLRVNNWIVQRLYDYAVNETVEL